MSKKILMLALAVIMLFAMGCQPGNHDNGGVEERNENGDFVFKGKIKSLDSEGQIDVEIIDSEVASGIYWVLISNETKFQNKSGNKISPDSLKVGDTIEITFSGQVMMSYPPRISAWVITLL